MCETRNVSASPHGAADSSAERPKRRLADKLLTAFHHACDQGEIDVARSLLKVIEFATVRSVINDRRTYEARQSLVAAHERLWHIEHPYEEEQILGGGEVTLAARDAHRRVR